MKCRISLSWPRTPISRRMTCSPSSPIWRILLQRAWRSLCCHALELRSLADHTVELARWTLKGFLSWIASLVDDYRPLVRAALAGQGLGRVELVHRHDAPERIGQAGAAQAQGDRKQASRCGAERFTVGAGALDADGRARARNTDLEAVNLNPGGYTTGGPSAGSPSSGWSAAFRTFPFAMAFPWSSRGPDPSPLKAAPPGALGAGALSRSALRAGIRVGKHRQIYVR